MKTRGGFSLIEVIFVMVILGVVASIASQIIVQVYENYILQRAIYNVSTKTELVANQIVNRLTYRIQGTTISKDHNRFLNGTATDTDWLRIEDLPTAGTKYTTIEWIGYDNDSLSAGQVPYWSGVANYENASINSFETPASKLDNVATIMSNLSNGKVDLSKNNPASVIFIQNDNYYTGSNEYNPLCMGMIPELASSSTDCIFPVWNDSNTSLTFTRDRDPNSATIRPKIITERYKLAWSAYAIAPESDGNGLFNLFLFSNYQPWNGDSYIDANTTKHLLMKNVSVFKFSENGGVIHFKLCATEKLGDTNISTCKEKVVIR
jgi:prepilin-type N-terminal cleavage/methylation domain-containing protein